MVTGLQPSAVEMDVEGGWSWTGQEGGNLIVSNISPVLVTMRIIFQINLSHNINSSVINGPWPKWLNMYYLICHHKHGEGKAFYYPHFADEKQGLE